MMLLSRRDTFDPLALVGRVAEGIAEGDPVGIVMVDVARSLTDLLDLRDCRWETVPFDRPEALPTTRTSHRPTLTREGELELDGHRWSPWMIGLPWGGFDLLVIARGAVRGRFVCVPRSRRKVAADRVHGALTLCDQAATALLLDAAA